MCRLFVSIVILWMFSAMASLVFGQEQKDMVLAEDAKRELASSIVVIRLKYANAEELAATLAPILPPGVTVVAYPPTNSLIISGDPVAFKTPNR